MATARSRRGPQHAGPRHQHPSARPLSRLAPARSRRPLAAAELAAQEGISIEVVDPRSLVPLDIATIVNSVKKTSRAIVVDGGYRQYGITGEIAATIAEEAFDWLDAPVLRMGAENVPIPFSKSLEPLVLPSPRHLAEAASKLVRGT
jgi:pyruvate/2-oxoglutarate/acetoin dehydrogenase E1 component